MYANYNIKQTTVACNNSRSINGRKLLNKSRTKQITFKFAFKNSSVGLESRSAGREFHADGSATEKDARSANLVLVL